MFVLVFTFIFTCWGLVCAKEGEEEEEDSDDDNNNNYNEVARGESSLEIPVGSRSGITA